MRKPKFIRGVSLLETLVTVGIFAVLGVVVTLAVSLSVQGTKKGETTVKVRENLDYAMAVIERQLRNAARVEPCPNPDPTRLDYYDLNDEATSFSCINMGGEDGYIASGSSRLTTSEAAISGCSFVCLAGSASTPPQISIDISSEGVSLTTKIDLRTY